MCYDSSIRKKTKKLMLDRFHMLAPCNTVTPSLSNRNMIGNGLSECCTLAPETIEEKNREIEEERSDIVCFDEGHPSRGNLKQWEGRI